MADYEITSNEFTEEFPVNPWKTPVCSSCAMTIGHHYQTAEGKLFCVKYPGSTADGGTEHG